MVVVLCSESLERDIKLLVGRSSLVQTSWELVRDTLRLATGLIVVQRFLSDATVQQLQSLRRDFPLTRIAIVCHIGARNVDLLAVGGIQFNRFLGIEQVDTELPGVVREFTTTDFRTLLTKAIQSHCKSQLTSLAVDLVFARQTPPESVAVLASLLDCTPDRLRDRLRHDLGLQPRRLLRWSILIRALESSSHGMHRFEIAEGLGVAGTTIDRDANDLLGLTFGAATPQGARSAGMKLLEHIQYQVGRHEVNAAHAGNRPPENASVPATFRG